jgi:dTDP-4-dehydrorhamnose 3,5-epimerase
MASLAERGVDPRVVDDQIGRLTFTNDLTRAITHLLQSRQPYGVYNATSSGEPTAWADIARDVFRLTGNDPARVQGVSTDEYFATANSPVAPRPRNSILDLSKIEDSGFRPSHGPTALAACLG